MHRDLCDLGSQIQIRILPKERTLSSRINLIAHAFSRVQVGHCQSVLRWYLRLTFDINENYSNGIAKGWGFSYAANLRKW